MLDYIRTHKDDSALSLADGMYQTTREFVQGDLQDDDITSVVIKLNVTPDLT